MRVRELLTLRSFEKITLLAGEEGLDRPVTWPYVKQTEDISNWVHGGELIFVTGMEMQYTQEQLENLVQQCHQCAASGIVILRNQDYITTIPSNVLEISNRLQLPIFEMPWTLKIIDVTQEIANLIVLNQYSNQYNNEFFAELLSSSPDVAQIDEAAIRCGISMPCVMVAFSVEIKEARMQRLQLLRRQIDALIGTQNASVISTIQAGTLICCISSATADSMQDLYVSMENLALGLVKAQPEARVFAGIGCTVSSIENLHLSYQQADKTLELAKKSHKKVELLQYDRLGVLQLALQNQPTVILQYCRQLLHPLAEQDRLKNTVYVQTLYVFLQQDCSLLRAAKELFVHRNTMVYRIEKIKTLLGCQLDTLAQKSEYYNALLLADFYHFTDQL